MAEGSLTDAVECGARGRAVDEGPIDVSDQRVEVENNDKLDVGNDQTQDVKMNRTRKVGMDEKVTIGLTQHIKAGTKITLECGASKITMDPMSIKIESMMISVKASLTLDEEGLFTTVKGNAFLTLKGGMIFIN